MENPETGDQLGPPSEAAIRNRRVGRSPIARADYLMREISKEVDEILAPRWEPW
jgi:hypothetical protein